MRLEQGMNKTVETDDIVKLVRQAGLRPTRQRFALASQLFMNGDRHVTAEQLHSESLDRGFSISLATVYNTLNRFTTAGLLRELVVDSGRSYFDTNSSAHHHLYCEETGKLSDIPGDNAAIEDFLELPGGTKVSRIDIIIRVKNSKATV